jgi:OmpA-OmpF porin, OOP family
MTKKSLCLAVSLLCLATAAFAEGESGFYVGVSAGTTKGNLSEEESNRNLTDLGRVSVRSSVDNKDSAYRISGGYRLSPIVAFEAHYTDLGKYSTESSALLAPNVGPGTVAGTFKASGFGVDALIGAPLAQGFSIYGRVGVMRAKTETSFASSGSIQIETPNGPGFRASPSANTTAYNYGIGAQYDINKQIGIRAEGQRYSKLGNRSTGGELKVDVFSIGAVFNF